MKREEDIHRDEAAFHDRWAESTDPDQLLIKESFEAITAQENRFILDLLGDVRGKRILDIGSGLGESALYFASLGAQVVATDISEKMLELCRQNAAAMGLEINTVVSSAENLNVKDDSFDIVYAANALHHVPDRNRMLQNARSALKPGGCFVAWDPLKYNPIIGVYRRLASDVRTHDESPLGFDDLKTTRKYFRNVGHREFGLATLLIFIKYYIIDRKDPSSTRYWKEVLKETGDTIGWWYRPLLGIDNLILRVPIVRAMAWNMVQWGYK